MSSIFASSAVDHGFEPQSGQTKDCKIGICCFSARHAALRRKSKDMLAQNQDNVSEWGEIHSISPWYSWKIAVLALKNNHSLTQ